MSVIAKMIIRGVHQFATGSLIELSCICDNDLMAEYADTHEDKLFTKFSPWGEIKLHQPGGWQLGGEGDCFYVMITHKEESANLSFPGAVVFDSLRVSSITDYGDNMAKRLEMTEGWGGQGRPRKGCSSFNWKMSVDNPPVFDQLKAGCVDYWVAFYPASSFNRDGVIEAAHASE